MPSYKIAEAARLLGVSDDTVRRWVDGGTSADDGRRPGRDPRAMRSPRAPSSSRRAPSDPGDVLSSARNRFVGLVTRVQLDGVMAQVDIQAGPHRVVSLMSAEAVRELGLEVGSLAVADRQGHERHRRDPEGLTVRHGARIRLAALVAASVSAPERLRVRRATRIRTPRRRPAPTSTEPELTGELTVYAAASLKAAFDELATRFEERASEPRRAARRLRRLEHAGRAAHRGRARRRVRIGRREEHAEGRRRRPRDRSRSCSPPTRWSS